MAKEVGQVSLGQGKLLPEIPSWPDQGPQGLGLNYGQRKDKPSVPDKKKQMIQII